MIQHSFLEILVNKLLSDNSINISNTVIVLPNKRAKVFLLDAFKLKLTNYTLAPQIISVEDFIQDISKTRAIDPIELLFEFYDVYISITKNMKI